MRVSLSWLQDLVQVTEPAEALAERLSMAGFEVEAIDDLSSLAQGVVVGHVLGREKHPNADKLSVCSVDVGAAEPLQIVCGASNVRAGIHVPVATVGAVLPAVNLTIKAGELRGVARWMASPCSRTSAARPWWWGHRSPRFSVWMMWCWNWRSPPTGLMASR